MGGGRRPQCEESDVQTAKARCRGMVLGLADQGRHGVGQTMKVPIELHHRDQGNDHDETVETTSVATPVFTRVAT